MYHSKTAWLLVILTATQRPGAMERLTAEEMKWRSLVDQQQHASAEWSRRPTNFLLTTLDLDIYSRPGLCNWGPAPKTSRQVLSQLAGSDHRPVLLAINLHYRPSNPKTFPRWNNTGRCSHWEMFSHLTNEYCQTVKADHFNINKATDSLNQSVLRAASETIPCGPRKNYRPYWTEELKELENEVARTREKAENNQTLQNNIAHKACTVKYRKAHIHERKNRKVEIGQRWQQTLETDQGHEWWGE